jgi:hypothetical protein
MMGFCKIKSEHFPIHMISKMSVYEPDNRLQLKTVVDRITTYQLTSEGELKIPKDTMPGINPSLKFSRDHILGKGGQAVIHLGVWKGSIVAVKRISTRSKNPEVTKKLKLQNLDHRNIVKFFGSEKDNDFM